MTHRLLQFIPTFLGVTLLVFVLLRLAPGEPAGLSGHEFGGITASPESLAQWRQLKGLEDPLPVQYLRWLWSFVRFDFGTSLYDEQPVIDAIADAAPRTLLLTGLALFFTYLIAIPLGIHSALRRGSRSDRVVSSALFVLYSVPAFWLALLLVVLFCGGEFLSLFPIRGLLSDGMEQASFGSRAFDLAWHLVLPVFCLTYPSLAHTSRYQRTAMLEVMSQDYIRTARAKGLSERAVVLRHALRNAALPIISLLSLDLAWVFGGSVVVERIFTIRGVGMLAFEAILRRDYPMIMGVVSIVAVLNMLGMLLGDIAYAWADPRIHYERHAE